MYIHTQKHRLVPNPFRVLTQLANKKGDKLFMFLHTPPHLNQKKTPKNSIPRLQNSIGYMKSTIASREREKKRISSLINKKKIRTAMIRFFFFFLSTSICTQLTQGLISIKEFIYICSYAKP